MTLNEIDKLLEQCSNGEELRTDIYFHFEKMDWHKRKLMENITLLHVVGDVATRVAELRAEDQLGMFGGDY